MAPTKAKALFMHSCDITGPVNNKTKLFEKGVQTTEKEVFDTLAEYKTLEDFIVKEK